MFRIIRKAGFAFGSDQIVSQHKTLGAAKRAFQRINGAAALIAPDGTILDQQIA